jgi:hypothetical protein
MPWWQLFCATSSYILLTKVKDLHRVLGAQCAALVWNAKKTTRRPDMSDPPVIAFPDAQKVEHGGRKLLSMAP